MSVKLRSVYTCKLHFTAYRNTACSAHTSSIYHDRVQADDGWNSQFLGQLTYEFHHDHWSDGNTYIVLFTLIFNQVFDNLSYHALTLVRTIICSYVQISCNCF